MPRKPHLLSIETTNGTIPGLNTARPPLRQTGRRETNERDIRETERGRVGERERHRYILFPCDGVANPIKDVPTGGRPIRLSPGWRSPHGQPCALPLLRAGSFPSPKGNDPNVEGTGGQRDRRRVDAGREGRGGGLSHRPDNPIEALILTRQPEIPAGLLNRVRSIRGHNGGATAEYRRVPRLTRSC